MIRRILVILGLAKPQWRVNFSKIPSPWIAKRDATLECTCGHKVLQGELAMVHNHKHLGWERSGRPKYQARYVRHPACHTAWLRDNDWHPQFKSLPLPVPVPVLA